MLPNVQYFAYLLTFFTLVREKAVGDGCRTNRSSGQANVMGFLFARLKLVLS